jgi:hypothetical protein
LKSSNAIHCRTVPTGGVSAAANVCGAALRALARAVVRSATFFPSNVKSFRVSSRMSLFTPVAGAAAAACAGAWLSAPAWEIGIKSSSGRESAAAAAPMMRLRAMKPPSGPRAC